MQGAQRAEEDLGVGSCRGEAASKVGGCGSVVRQRREREVRGEGEEWLEFRK